MEWKIEISWLPSYTRLARWRPYLDCWSHPSLTILGGCGRFVFRAQLNGESR
jgi:hypothetical protein